MVIVLRSPALPEHAAYRFAHLAHRILAVLGEIKRCRRAPSRLPARRALTRSSMCTLAQRFSPVPMCLATPDFFATRSTTAPARCAVDAAPAPVDQAGRDHDGARRSPPPPAPWCRWRRAAPATASACRRVLVEHCGDQLAAGARADDAGAAGLHVGFAGAGQAWTIASAAPRWPALAAFTVTSASRAACASTSASSSVPRDRRHAELPQAPRRCRLGAREAAHLRGLPPKAPRPPIRRYSRWRR